MLRVHFPLKRVASIAISGCLIAGLLVLMSIAVPNKNSESQVLSRKIDTVVLPLPPPPPPKSPLDEKHQEPLISADSIILNTNSVGVKFSERSEMKNLAVENVKLPEFDFKKVDLSKTIISDYPEVDMKELDEIPTLLSRVPMRIPRELRKRGVRSVRVVTEIFIDEAGNAYLRRIIDNPYPEMEDVIREFLKTVQFTPPTRNGLRVHAVYSWPLKFTEV